MEELLKETREDVKEIKTMLHQHMIDEVETKAKLDQHSGWFKVIGAFIIGMFTYLVKGKFQ